MVKAKIFLNRKGVEVCGAIKRSNGKHCMRTELTQLGLCAQHSRRLNRRLGRQYMPEESSRVRRVGRVLPKHLQQTFADSLNDPDLLSLEPEVGIVDARLLSLIEKLSTRESADAIAILASTLSDLQKLLHSDEEELDLDEADSLLERAFKVLGGSQQDQQIWNEILTTIEARRKLSDTERRLLEAKQNAIDAAQMRALIVFFLYSIRYHVLPLGDDGKKAVRGVTRDLARLIPDVGGLAVKQEQEGEG